MDTLLISFDSSNDRDHILLIIGRKRPNESIEIINAFQDEEAKDLYLRLITKKEDKNVSHNG